MKVNSAFLRETKFQTNFPPPPPPTAGIKGCNLARRPRIEAAKSGGNLRAQRHENMFVLIVFFLAAANFHNVMETI